jgi:Zn ribbon nucleic-acid-binding protein
MTDNEKLSICPICGTDEFHLYHDSSGSHVNCNNCPYRLEDNDKSLLELIRLHNDRDRICLTCEGDPVLADIAKRMLHRPDIAFRKIRQYQGRLIELGQLDIQPCFICGYEGDDYHNQDIHKCMNLKNE